MFGHNDNHKTVSAEYAESIFVNISCIPVY